MTTVFVQIGNSDDKLSQVRWSMFVDQVNYYLNRYSNERHFFGFAPADARWQNACWCVVFNDQMFMESCQIELGRLAKRYEQSSIAWSEVATTKFIEGIAPVLT